MAGFFIISARSKRRSFISLSLALLAALGDAAAASEVALRPFSASYDLYQGGLHLAITDISLQRYDGAWRWVSVTRARGIYRLFTDKRPYVETRFDRFGDEFRVTEILLDKNGGERHEETARFDWEAGRAQVLRKNKRSEIAIDEAVYDYLSIHLLAADSGQSGPGQQNIEFYNRGRLVKSSFVYSGQQAVSIDGKSVQANVYEQVVARSKSKVKYYYDAEHPLLPLRIEKLEAGESPSILALRQVEWGL